MWEYTKRQDDCTDEGSFALQNLFGNFVSVYSDAHGGHVRINKDDR